MFGVTYLIFWAAMVGAWLTNLINAIEHEFWLLILASVVFFPVGIVRGIGIWFGVW